MSWIDDYCDETCSENCLRIDGFDHCCLGMGELNGEDHLVYSVELIIEELQEQGMTQQDAIEYFEYNIRGTRYSGANMPVLMFSMDAFKTNGEVLRDGT